MTHLDRYYRLWRTHVLKHGGIRKFWSTPGRLHQGRLDHLENIMRGYFLDFSSDAQYPGPFDGDGVPMIDYGGKVGIRYNPWAAGHFALAIFHKFLNTNSPALRERFLALADWFVAQSRIQPSGAILWLYDFDFPPALKAPWASSLAQSVAISVLLRAYLWTEHSRYLDIAQQAFRVFTLSVNEGGVSTQDDGYLFFEETVPVHIYHILNGHISTLYGIYEYALVTKDPQAYTLFDEGVRSLVHYLPKYDTGWASLYSLSHLQSGSRLKDVASLFYQKFHTLQLAVLYRLTELPIFEEYCQRWESYLSSFLCRSRTFGAKALFKLLRY